MSRKAQFTLSSQDRVSAQSDYSKNSSTPKIEPGELRVCDPHISASTLFPFSTIGRKASALKILTSNIYDRPKFDDYGRKLTKETGVTLDVRVSQRVHDRYLISGKKCWSIGASVKDLGNKDCIIREISEVTGLMAQLFEEDGKKQLPSMNFTQADTVGIPHFATGASQVARDLAHLTFR